jgi:hypothetical protein
MTVDPVTGDYWMVDAGGGIGRVHHRSGAVTSLASTAFSSAWGIVHDETTDTFVCSNQVARTVLRVNRQMQVVSSFVTPTPIWSIRVSPDTGNIHVLDGTSTLTEWSPIGGALRTVRPGLALDRFSLELYGSLPVSGIGSAARGTKYELRLGFPGVRGLSYGAALSLGGIRPGIPLPGGRRLALAADALFRLTAAHGDIPGITTGLRGTLDGAGRAKAMITIPPGIPPGTRIFASAVVLDRNAPGGLHVGNAWAFEVR